MKSEPGNSSIWPRYLCAWSWIAPVLALLLSAEAGASHTTVINNGPNSNRVNVVFLGDGYTAAQINTVYPAHIVAMTNHMFNPPPGILTRDPYPRYKNYFNVHRVNVISNESGADLTPENIFRDTALDAQYFFDGATERLLYINETKANNALSAGLGDAGFSADIRLLTVNDTRYGGGGGTYAVYAGGNNSATEVALHELGHSFNGLADEYGGFTLPYGGAEPAEINVTKNSMGAKWSHWLGHNQPGIGVIGAYPGARYYDTGLYRPSQNSKMRTLDRPFDAISREKIVLDIYDLVDPLDGFLSNTLPLVDPPELWIDPIDPNVIDLEWFVNGSIVAGAASESFTLLDYGYGPGLYTVQARAFDPTGFDLVSGWVRRDQDQLEQFVTWTVTQTVPEPGTIALAVIGLLMLVGACYRNRRRP
ncbi:MAG: M64 family metallopeptidase [Pirellulales bacterium]